MLGIVPYMLVHLGSVLMAYNIHCFASYARRLQERDDWGEERTVLYVPIMLLVLFLLGYLAVGFLGEPDLVVGIILLGGSLFVHIIYQFMCRIISRIQANEHLESELRAAEESSRAKMSFLSSMSHEMRTPMNAIVGLNTLALKNPDLPDETRDQLEKMSVASGHLENLIDNILDLSRAESEQLVLKEEPFRLCALLREINVAMELECAQKGLGYRCELAKEACAVYAGDAGRIRQVLLIILENAIKFTPAPGSVSFAVGPAVDGGLPEVGERYGLRFVVTDTGVGMDEDFLPQLFGAFAQEDATTTSRFGGSGLGLALAKQLVTLMDGSIGVRSAKGEGSTFVVSLALEVSEVPAEEKDEAVGDGVAQEGGTLDLSGRHILVVDDIDVNAEILVDLLDLEGASADCAENGRVAVDMFAQSSPGRYDAILMDLRMPVMDGFESARAIRELDRPDAQTVPILALTANAYADDRRRAFEAGMDAHLAKPVDADELYYTMATLIAHGQEVAARQGASEAGDA